jgi:ribosomal protein S4
MYYGVKEKPTLRLVRDIKIKRRQSRVRILFEKFERRLDVILVRLGWVKGLKKARKLILSGGIGISKSKDSQLLIITDSSFCLSPGDRLYILDKGFIYRHIKIRMRKVAWRIQSRCLIPSPPHPRKFDPKRFRKYVKGKRRFA